jgi:thioredoxin 1
MITSITQHNFTPEVENSEKPVVVEVYATWCGPCQHMMPMFEELSNELSETYKFAKLNVDEAREIAIKFNVSSVPTFLFIKDGELKGQEVGYMSKDDLESKIKAILS